MFLIAEIGQNLEKLRVSVHTTDILRSAGIFSRHAGDRYASANPRIGTRGLILDSPLQAQNLEVADERDAIVAVEATGICSGLVVGALTSAAAFRPHPSRVLPGSRAGPEVLHPVGA